MEDNNVPMGLIGSAVGGTLIEQWSKAQTLEKACNQTQCPGPACGGLFNGMVTPFVNMTIKAVVWYQGENNIFEGNGMSSWLNHTGYGCMQPVMVAQWRKLWSVVPGTTDAMFPFGVTSIASGGDEGHPNIAYFRLAQTGLWRCVAFFLFECLFISARQQISVYYPTKQCPTHLSHKRMICKTHGPRDVTI